MAKSMKVLLVIILIVILVLLVWFFFVKDVWQNNQFSVKYNGKTLANNKKMNFYVDRVYKIEVKDGSTNEQQSYSVKLVANKSDTLLMVDGRKVKLTNVDLTDDFVSDVTANGFALCQPANLRDLLASKFSGNTVTIANEKILFDLVVTSANGKNVVTIPLYYASNIYDITIDSPHVVF